MEWPIREYIEDQINGKAFFSLPESLVGSNLVRSFANLRPKIIILHWLVIRNSIAENVSITDGNSPSLGILNFQMSGTDSYTVSPWDYIIMGDNINIIASGTASLATSYSLVFDEKPPEQIEEEG